MLSKCQKNLTIDDLVVKKHNYGTREKNKFKVAVNHTGKERSPECFKENCIMLYLKKF